AAAAEIKLAPRAARARLLHPCAAAERVEGRRVRPDIGERTLAHVPEFKAGNRLGGVAGQHLARRRHVERAPTPAADAGLWIAGIVVGHHGVDDDAAVVSRAQFLHRRRGTLDLLAASLSWIETCTWSSPASASAPRVLSVIPTAEVMRLV